MMRTLRKPCFLFLILLLPALAAAQEKPDVSASAGEQEKRPRPKIGIALEGGGALGLAHIGVLEWFEEHRIPVDYIAGTTIGG
jgi:NTE family protein